MTKREAVKLFGRISPYLARILAVSSWHIKVVYQKDNEINEDEITEMSLDNFNIDYNEVSLTIYYKAIDDEEHFKRALLHEFLHIVVSPAMRYLPPKHGAEEEKFVSHLTNVLYPLLVLDKC